MNKLPRQTGDYSAFNEWITSMSDDDYSDFLDFDATDAQEEKALEVRDRPDDDSAIDDQFSEPEPTPREQMMEQAGIKRQGGIRGFFKRLFRR